MKFEDTYLNDNILDALYDMRFDEMTPIQERCIPESLDGYDVLADRYWQDRRLPVAHSLHA